jgi:hypothetical protein
MSQYTFAPRTYSLSQAPNRPSYTASRPSYTASTNLVPTGFVSQAPSPYYATYASPQRYTVSQQLSQQSQPSPNPYQFHSPAPSYSYSQPAITSPSPISYRTVTSNVAPANIGTATAPSNNDYALKTIENTIDQLNSQLADRIKEKRSQLKLIEGRNDIQEDTKKRSQNEVICLYQMRLLTEILPLLLLQPTNGKQNATVFAMLKQMYKIGQKFEEIREEQINEEEQRSSNPFVGYSPIRFSSMSTVNEADLPRSTVENYSDMEIKHLENLVTDLTKTRQSKDAEIQQLKFELAKSQQLCNNYNKMIGEFKGEQKKLETTIGSFAKNLEGYQSNVCSFLDDLNTKASPALNPKASPTLNPKSTDTRGAKISETTRTQRSTVRTVTFNAKEAPPRGQSAEKKLQVVRKHFAEAQNEIVELKKMKSLYKSEMERALQKVQKINGNQQPTKRN